MKNQNWSQPMIAKLERRSRLAFLGAIGVLILVLGLSIIVVPIDVAKDLCPVDTSLADPRKTVVVIDLSDILPGMSPDKVVETINNIVKGLRKFERFTVFVIQPDVENLSPIFSMCLPNFSIADHFNMGRRERENQKNKFTDDLEKALKDAIKNQKESGTTPIVETIREISHSHYWGSSNRLYLFSDLLQNSSELSSYKKAISFGSFLQLPAGSIVESMNFTKTSVGISVIDRRNLQELQNNAKLFWEQLFMHIGVSAPCLKQSYQTTGFNFQDSCYR
jgi:hypothetical protein